LGLAAEAAAQVPVLEGSAEPAGEGEERKIDFEANALTYDDEANTVTASGNVVVTSGGQSVRAETVTWDRNSGEITASGGLLLVDSEGNRLYSDSLVLTEELRAGAMENMLLALREGGRLAAAQGERDEQGRLTLDRAVYTGCAVEDGDGCPKTPSWRITAERVTVDFEANRVRFKGAMLELFGMRLVPLPGLTTTTNGSAISGFLVPNLRVSASNGIEVNGQYYWRIDDNEDIAVGGHLFTEVAPLASIDYRKLSETGAFQATGYLTRSSRIGIGSDPGTEKNAWRGYFGANGKFQFDPHWSLTGSVRAASDRTFLRRYDISRDDRLRSTVNLERIDDQSYLSIAGWITQTMRFGATQGQVPVALPVIDYRRRVDDPLLGGQVELQLNSLAITRTSGQDTQRAFAGATWNLRRITAWGQVISATALVRGDVYHSGQNELTATASYQGEPGWQGRGMAVGAVDVKWPLVGEVLGGEQVLTPRFQVVASPEIRNLDVPNEDSRAIDLEDSNLFALNRFPGYDRVEDGVRFTYGLDWQFTRPGLRIKSTVGQSYRLTDAPQLFPDGTGLTDRVSDFVGRTEVHFKDYIQVTHRFRLDKDSLAVRRNEFDASIGDNKTYLELGYLRLNRDITGDLEDLQDREELRLAGRVAFADYWSIFGAGVFNLTDAEEDASLTSDGFEPIRTRLGIAYADDCLELGLSWRRDFVASGDAEKGNTFQVYISFSNLGF